MKDMIIVSTQSAVQQRASEVQTQLKKLSNSIEDGFFDICDLLCEAQTGDYHVFYGYGRFGDWVETASGLDMSARQAFYLVNISKKAKQLGLSREQLKLIKISKLKEIFSLDLDEHVAAVKELVEEAPGLSLEEVKNRVRGLKGESETLYITLKLDKAIKDTMDRAFELARRNYGSQMQNGEAADISVSHCFELLCVEYLNDPNNNPDNQAIAEAPLEIECEEQP